MQPPKRLVKAVIFDWSGTIIDYGSTLSTRAMVEAFKARELVVTPAEVRLFTGQDKRDHIRELLKIDSVNRQFVKIAAENPSERDVCDLYRVFEPLMIELLQSNYEFLPDVKETIERLHIMDVKVGSTTDYSKAIMSVLLSEAERLGLQPDSTVTPGEVHRGRPYPWMIYRNAENLGAFPLSGLVKVGDTVQDVWEARNAGCWAVGVLQGGALVGKEKNEFDALDLAERSKLMRSARKTLVEAGADFVIDGIAELPKLLRRINTLLERGQAPGRFFHLCPQQYKLTGAGPAATSQNVKLALMSDLSPSDTGFTELVQRIRHELTRLATEAINEYTCVLVPSTADVALEALLRGAVRPDGKLMVLSTGPDGREAAELARRVGIRTIELNFESGKGADASLVEKALEEHPDTTHAYVAQVDKGTAVRTSLNLLLPLLHRKKISVVVDGRLGLGALPLDVNQLHVDFLLGSSCYGLEGPPGVSFVVARKEALSQQNGVSGSMSLDLRALLTAQEKTESCLRDDAALQQLCALEASLRELEEEGGPAKRLERYEENQRILLSGLADLGFEVRNAKEHSSPLLTLVQQPASAQFSWGYFQESMKSQGFAVGRGERQTFLVGTFGRLFPEDMKRLVTAIGQIKNW